MRALPGFRWVIRNCRVADVRCVGIVCGNRASSENIGFDLTTVGHHLVRDNHILRCCQAGIHVFKGWGGSVIEGNLIEDINVHKEFGEQYRYVFEEYILKGRPGEEVAEELNVTRNAVYISKNRILARVRLPLAPSGRASPPSTTTCRS